MRFLLLFIESITCIHCKKTKMLFTIKDRMLVFGYCPSYNTPGHKDKLNTTRLLVLAHVTNRIVHTSSVN